MESPEFRMFQRFMLSLQGLRAYRTEWVIYGEAENIAGHHRLLCCGRRASAILV